MDPWPAENHETTWGPIHWRHTLAIDSGKSKRTLYVGDRVRTGTADFTAFAS
jgi:hypothetical protein